MSCGNHHETPCSEVLEQVYVYLDGEIGPDECDKIREHLDECGPCLRQYGLDQAVKALVARSCGCDLAPDALRDKVLARIREVRVEISQIEYRPD
ncbi:MAG TPA: mycothiol system anti-sigma-R factor [Acidothermaceae bacterium]|jgi:mycothiol system anti-sigma-R factor|nr:mycothiol system anti-sigma-R factor [Acidothermaceae bacterium]